MNNLNNKLNYKITKYVEKLKNADTLEETDKYQTKLRKYHRANKSQSTIQSGGDETLIKQIQESIGKLGDKIDLCNQALSKISGLAERVVELEKKLELIDAKLKLKQ